MLHSRYSSKNESSNITLSLAYVLCQIAPPAIVAQQLIHVYIHVFVLLPKQQVGAKLSDHVHVLHEYTDKTLQLQHTMDTQVR
jgi:GTP cyclohydrolase FolE2